MGGELTAEAVCGREFFDRPVLAVARDLLGATVRHGPVALRVTEVEAYGGTDDPASHAYRGPTGRARVMFGPPGHAYVYFIYGMHWCFNVVCEASGRGAAVLLRAGAVVDGLAELRRRYPRLSDAELARGPGRFGRVLGVDGTFSGSDLTGGGPVTVHRGTPVPDEAVRRGPRIGISRATELPYRFWVDGEPSVSRPAGRSAIRRSVARSAGSAVSRAVARSAGESVSRRRAGSASDGLGALDAAGVPGVRRGDQRRRTPPREGT